MIDQYRVLPHRDVQALPDGTYLHKPCDTVLSEGDVKDANWCWTCVVTINKAAQRRGRAEWYK